MKTKTLEEEIEGLLVEWNRSILDKDVETAAQLRADGYTAALPDGVVLTKEEELALIASPGHIVESIKTQNVEVRGSGGTATAFFVNLIEGEFLGERINSLYRYTISFGKTDGRWRATSSQMVGERPPATKPTGGVNVNPSARSRETSGVASGAIPALRKSVSRTIKSLIKRGVGRLAAEAAPTFPELGYIPHKSGLDFVIPASRPEDQDAGSGALPVPPTELWLGYNYPVHGKAHVSRMLEIVYASGFSFKKSDRVLDLGCGAGRMIRHLQDLSVDCEIWGTDISAEHIYWCKQHLSPPFNFATTTTTPHLPFEDRSFNLIYCGSVFTHIDDLADAWLLELKRILAPGGRLYVTIHDNHTIELFESGRYDSAEIVRRIRSKEIYQRSKDSFGMFAAGRGIGSQVFYDVEYFSKTLRPMFDILSITPEAYFYQTAFLLQRKQQPGV